MGHTNQTTNLHLPQFIGSDKPTWLSDINGAFAAIDTAYGTIETDSAAAVTAAGNAVTAATSAASTASAAASTASTAASNASTALTTANNAALTANQAKTEADAAISAEPRGSVYVTADGSKTKSQLLAELALAVDFTKLTTFSALKIGDQVFRIGVIMSNYAKFHGEYISSSSVFITDIALGAEYMYTRANISSGSVVATDLLSTSEGEGTVYKIIY